MFWRFLLEQGLELELRASIADVIDFVDREIPRFSCGDYGYDISSGKGVVGMEWRLLVKPRCLKTSTVIDSPVGYMELGKLDEWATKFKVPPRLRLHENDRIVTDEEVNLFTNFILQVLRAFQGRGFINFPNPIPLQ